MENCDKYEQNDSDNDFRNANRDEDMGRVAQLQQQENTKLEKEEFLHLLSFLKNVKKLDLSKSMHSAYYMDILQQLDSAVYLKRIEWILPNIQADKHHLMLMMNNSTAKTKRFSHYCKFAGTLTGLQLYGYNSNNLPLLSTFKKLDHLDISNPQDTNLTLFHILNACQHLKTLNFTSFVDVPNHPDQLLQKMVRNSISTTTNLSTDDCSSLTHSQFLDSFALHVPSLILP